MNSRFDEAVEQILNEHVVEEAAPGMASVPGATEPEKKEKSFLGNLAKATLKGAGSALASGAKKAATLGAQAGAVGLGLTPNVGARAAGAVGGALGTAGSTIKQAWQDKGTTPSTTQPGQASQPSPANTTSTKTPTKTVANIIPTIQPQKINSTISNFPKLNADKTHLQSAIPNMLRGLRGNYSAQDLVQMVTGSVPPGSQVRQVASNTAAMNKIGTDLQNYLALSDKDRAQLKAQIPALLRGIKSNATIEDVGQLLTNVLT
jgi:hypothetical protein